MKAIIGLVGTPSLCNLGRPFIVWRKTGFMTLMNDLVPSSVMMDLLSVIHLRTTLLKLVKLNLVFLPPFCSMKLSTIT